MVPDKFNMVDMGGIDLIMMQGESVPGLHEKLMAAISNCQYQCLYNWLFDGVLIPPTYVQLEDVDGEVFLNEGVSVTSDDVIHIYSVEPGPVDPEIIPLLAEENGVYNVPVGKDGFNPVTVDVPSYTPVINSITITENGTYNVPAGVDGYAPVVVNVEGGSLIIDTLFVSSTPVTSGALVHPYTDYTEIIIVCKQNGNPLASDSSIYPTTYTLEKVGCTIGSNYCYITFDTTTSFVNAAVANGAGVVGIYGVK